MFFPGVLRGRPGPRLATTPTSRPRRSLSSPRAYCRSSVPPPRYEAVPPERYRNCSPARHDGYRSVRRRRPQTKIDAVPSHFEEPGGSGPRAFPCWWRGLTPQWPRSLRLGSASGFNVTRTPSDCNPAGPFDPARSRKNSQRRPTGRPGQAAPGNPDKR